jgi:hemerythrin-like domain-containing protein
MFATQDLRNEHEGIKVALAVLDHFATQIEAGKEVNLDDVGQLLDFLQTFADKCHHGKEENYLFKELINKGIPNESGPVGVMLQEHTQGRDYIAQMSRSLDDKNINRFNKAAVQYCDLLRRHIDKENNVLFMMADNVIDEQSQSLLFEQFEQHEENVVGKGVHEKLHAMIDTWAEAFEME